MHSSLFPSPWPFSMISLKEAYAFSNPGSANLLNILVVILKNPATEVLLYQELSQTVSARVILIA